MMAPDDPRHGSLAGYAAGCDVDGCGCMWASARYEKQRRYERLHGKPRTVDNTGSRRRIQALCAIGWTMRTVAVEIGWKEPQGLRRAMVPGKAVQVGTAQRIAAVYDRLSMRPGPSSSARIRAASKGWPPPLAWDDATIDDPAAAPYRPTLTPSGEIRRTDDYIDHVVVFRALNGQPVHATPAERQEIARRWVAAGRALNELNRLQGWNIYRDRREAAA